ncbi:hypothetical protein [Mucilaginibacter sp. UR6-11]|uniref:hypothetical protein n=1 Tax=Mucilaginibacter sp. UR6-11 TaxID=1435644 RepID=UPI001E537BA8|nr:hypothetical protein [Mucilaginibacter sp. UR6-11]MCC8426941.1 hypothetical protein [Mucilaginibacter sp. UR6-11]
MKKIIFITSALLLTNAIYSQDLPKKRIKIDTANSHGYEIMYCGDYISKNVNLYENGALKHLTKQFLREHQYSWEGAKTLIDSVNNLREGWTIPTTNQLRTIFVLTQTILDKKRIRIGSLDWQGIYLSYWCYNGDDKEKINTDSIYNAGSRNERDFEISDSNFKTGGNLVNGDDPKFLGAHVNGKIANKVLFIRKY